MKTKPTIAITMGDPSGIGPELCLKLLENKDVIISFQYYTVDNYNQNVHTQYSIITDNYTSKPKSNSSHVLLNW